MEDAITILKKILFDATGDVTQPDKRVWPIRADNYRKAVAAIGRYESSQQAVKADADIRADCGILDETCVISHAGDCEDKDCPIVILPR